MWQGERFRGHLHGEELHWDDGDVWVHLQSVHQQETDSTRTQMAKLPRPLEDKKALWMVSHHLSWDSASRVPVVFGAVCITTFLITLVALICFRATHCRPSRQCTISCSSQHTLLEPRECSYTMLSPASRRRAYDQDAQWPM